MQAPDWTIDYYTQLTIQLKMYRMLELLGQLNETGRKILTRRLYDYVFFTLFHAEPQKIREKSLKMRQLELPPILDLAERPRKQRMLLKWYLEQRDGNIARTMKLYRFLKRR